MKCEIVREHLSAYIDEELSEIERFQVEQHLARCPACAAAAGELRRLVALLHAGPEVEVPADFRPRLLARLARLPAPAAARKPAPAVPLWRRWGIPAAAAAAAAAVAFAQLGPRFSVAHLSRQGQIQEPASAGTTLSRAVTPAPAADPEPAAGSPAAVAPAPAPATAPGPASPSPAPNPAAGPAPAAPVVSPHLPGGDGSRTAALVEVPAEAPGGSLLEYTHQEQILVTSAREIPARVAALAQASGSRIDSQSATQSEAGGRVLTFLLSVPAEKLAELQRAVRALGQPAAAGPPTTVDLTGAYNARRLILQSRVEAMAGLLAQVNDPSLNEGARAAAREELERVKKEIVGLQEDLRILQERTRNHNLRLMIVEARGALAE